MSDRLTAVAGSIVGASLLATLGCEAIIEAHFDLVDLRDSSAEASTSAASSGGGTAGAGGSTGGAPSTGAQGGQGGNILVVSKPTNAWDASLTGEGTVTSLDGAIDCGSTCAASYANVRVTLAVTPAPGSTFHSWAGACATEPTTTCDVLVNADVSVSAHLVDSGANLWAYLHGGPGYDELTDVALDVDGNVVGGALITDSPSFGDLPLPSKGRDGALAKWDGKTGAWIADRTISSTSDEWLWAVAATPVADVLAAGDMAGTVVLEPGKQFPMVFDDPNDPYDRDAFVMKLDPLLVGLHGIVIGGPGDQTTWGVASDAAGGAVAIVHHYGPITAPFAIPAPGNGDVLVVKLTPALEVAWSVSFADPGKQRSEVSPVIDATGSATLVGTFASSAQVDWNGIGGSCPPLDNPSALDVMFLTRLAADGTCVFSRRLGEPDDVIVGAYALALGPDGSVFVSGWFQGKLDFDGAAADPDAVVQCDATQADAFVVRLGADGTWVPGTSWARRIGEPEGAAVKGVQHATDVAVDGAGNARVIVGGLAQIDAGGGATQPTSGPEAGDTVMVKYDAAGNHVWTHRYGPGDPAALACDSGGSCVLVGRHWTDVGGKIDFGGVQSNPLESSNWWDPWVARFAP